MIRFLQTPGPIKKVILGGLLTVVCVLMVVTLVPGFGNSSFLGGGAPGRGVIATVDGNEITTIEVQKQARQMIQRQFPRGGAQASALLPFFASQAAQQLINEDVMLAEADRLGLRATDQEVQDGLQNDPRYGGLKLFDKGNFVGEQEYELRLQEYGLNVSEFEKDVRNQIRVDKLRGLAVGGAVVTEREVRNKFNKENTKIKFDYAVLKKEDVLKGIQANDVELKAFYERNKGSYNNSIPEKRKIRYVLLESAKIQNATQVSQQELQAYYDQHRDEFRVPEQVNVRHILIKTPLPGAGGKVDAKAVDAARQKAEDLVKELKGGGNFAELAKKNSEDTSSAKEGGSLGWIQRGRFPSADVEKVAFSLAKGGTSDIINAGYGFEIVHVDDKQDAHMKTLDEVKPQIEPVMKQQKTTQAVDAQATGLLSQARADGLEKAAAARNLQIVNTDFVSRTDSLPGIGNSPQFTQAVFAQPEKSPPDEAQLPQGFAVFEVLAIQPPSTPSFEQIRSRVEGDFKEERAGTLLTQRTQELSDRAKAGHDLKKAAKEFGATIKTSELVAPDGQVPDIGSMSGPAAAAFDLRPGEISGPINTENTGVVLSLVEKQEPTEQDFAGKKDQIRASLQEEKQEELFRLFVGNLREQMEKSGQIKVNEQELKSVTRTRGEEDEGE